MHPDITVFDKDFPDLRLVADVKVGDLTPDDLDQMVNQLARYMSGSKCHYALIFTPKITYVLKDDFTANGPEAIHVNAAISTQKLFSRMGRRVEVGSERELAFLARDWLERLAASYDSALPEDPEIVQALFPEIVSAVAEGRVYAEVAVQ
jgi:hypothetical protein